MLLWTVAVVGVLVGWASWARAGRLARKLEALTQSYWELRYDYTRLRSQVARLDTGEGEPEAEALPPAPMTQVAFVPLSSMKKKT